MKGFKTVAACLSAFMVFGMAGCGTKKQEINLAEGIEKLNLETAAPAEMKLPLADPGTVLTLVTTKSSNVAGKSVGLDELSCFKEAEKRTGIKIENKLVTDEKVNLLFASDELPDILYLNWNKFGGALKYGEDGQILPLDEEIAKNAPNVVKLMKENEQIKRELAEADGYIYYLPFIRNDEKLRVFQGFQIRQDWLDKLNLSMPTTKDEFYEVLKAFKEKDPNGNGQADEVPFIAEKTFGVDRMFNWWGMDAIYSDNGVIKCGWIQPEYKEFVTWLNKLYSEGLIDPDYAISDRTQFDYKVSNQLGGVWYGLAGGCLGRLTTLMQPVNPEFKLAGMPWLEAADGGKYVVNSEYASCVTDLGIAVTTQCKNLEAAVKWMDYAYSEEGQILYNFGVEGVSYTMENGIPTYTEEITKNPDGLPMSEAIALHAWPTGYATVQSVHYFDQYMMGAQKDAIDVWKDVNKSRSIPNLKYTVEEAENAKVLYNEIANYNSEMFNKFITGKESLDKFDDFVATLKNMGIEDVIKANQTAYDRFVKN